MCRILLWSCMLVVLRTELSAAPPPKTPAGLDGCAHIFVPQGALPRDVGETLRYTVSLSGMAVGTVDFQIARGGRFAGAAMVDYRSLFSLDALAAAVVPVRGRAASLVPDLAFWPRRSMSRFNLGDKQIEENCDFSDAGDAVAVRVKKDGASHATQRRFPTAVVDFVSGFYLLRRVPRQAPSCAIIYGNERAYTVWLEPRGTADVKTPAGMRSADKFALRFASERANKVSSGSLFLGVDTRRLPLLACIDGARPLEARLHRYASK